MGPKHAILAKFDFLTFLAIFHDISEKTLFKISMNS